MKNTHRWLTIGFMFSLFVLATPSLVRAQFEADTDTETGEVSVTLQINGQSNPLTVERGSRITIRWTSFGAAYCLGNWTKKTLPKSGQQSGKVTASRSFTVICRNKDTKENGNDGRATIFVTVRNAGQGVRKDALPVPRAGEDESGGQGVVPPTGATPPTGGAIPARLIPGRPLIGGTTADRGRIFAGNFSMNAVVSNAGGAAQTGSVPARFQYSQNRVNWYDLGPVKTISNLAIGGTENLTHTQVGGIGTWYFRLCLGAGTDTCSASSAPLEIVAVVEESSAPSAPPSVSNQPPALKAFTGASSVIADTPDTWKVIAHDPDGTALTVKIQWSDGTSEDSKSLTASRANAQAYGEFSHTFAKGSGIYTAVARATVTDASGASAHQDLAITVTPKTAEPPANIPPPPAQNPPAANQDPIIKSWTGPTSIAGQTSGTWNVVALDPDGTALTVRVGWGDGTPESVKSFVASSANAQTGGDFSHTYTNGGVAYTVRATVTDASGASVWSDTNVSVTSSLSPTQSPPTTPPTASPAVSLTVTGPTNSYVAPGSANVTFTSSGVSSAKIEACVNKTDCTTLAPSVSVSSSPTSWSWSFSRTEPYAGATGEKPLFIKVTDNASGISDFSDSLIYILVSYPTSFLPSTSQFANIFESLRSLRRIPRVNAE